MNNETAAENMITPIDELRLQKLFHYQILDTHAENSFDRISNLAADILEVDNAGICFITNNEVFIKSEIGKSIDKNELMNPVSSAILSDDILVLSGDKHALLHEIGFFVAVPIKTPDGFNIGAIYVFDKQTKKVSKRQELMLKQLSELIIDQLETRIAIRKTLTAQDDRLHVLIHDLKNPMTTISLQSELVSRMPNIDEKATLIVSKINLQSKRMVESLNEILSSAKKETGSFKPQKLKINIKDILEIAIKNLEVVALKKNHSFKTNIDTTLEVFGDPDKITELFYHLLHNAIKFSPIQTTTLLSYQIAENSITIGIKDNGVGLSAVDLEKLFIKFAKLSPLPTAKENSNGLGLTLVKMLIDMHHGKLWAESEGVNKGSTFYVQLPIK